MAILPVEFTIDVNGETTNEHYMGLFKIRPRLTHRELLAQDQVRRDLLGPKGEEASAQAVGSAMIFAKIWAHMVSAPDWWTRASKGLDLFDEAPVLAVYDAIVDAEKKAIAAVVAAGKQAAEELKK